MTKLVRHIFLAVAALVVSFFITMVFFPTAPDLNKLFFAIAGIMYFVVGCCVKEKA